MGYFDFLDESDLRGDSPAEAARDNRLKPKTKYGGAAFTEPVDVPGRNPEPPDIKEPTLDVPKIDPSEGIPTSKPPEGGPDAHLDLAKVKKRTAAKDFVLKKAIEAIDSAYMNMAGHSDEIDAQHEADADALKTQLRAADPTEYARILETHFSQYRPDARPDLRDVKQAALAYGKLAQEDKLPNVGYEALKQRGADVPDAERINAVKAWVESLQKENTNPAITDSDRQENQKKIDAANADLARMGKPAAPAQPKPDLGGFGVDAKVVSTPLGMNPLEALKHVTGDDDETMKFIMNLMNKKREAGNFDWDDKTNIGIEIQSLMDHMPPEAKGKFFGSLLMGGQLGGAQAMAPVVSQAAKNDPQTQANLGVQQAEGEYRQKLRELRDADPMSTTGGAILFVAMSMLLGPKMATLILYNRNKIGKLQDDVDWIKYKLRNAQAKQAAALQRQRDMEERKVRQREWVSREDYQQKHRIDMAGVQLVNKFREMDRKAQANPDDVIYRKLKNVVRDHMLAGDKAMRVALSYQRVAENEFADAGLRATAQQNLDVYRKKAIEEYQQGTAKAEQADEYLIDKMGK